MMIRELINSMRPGVNACIDSNGGQTRYCNCQESQNTEELPRCVLKADKFNLNPALAEHDMHCLSKQCRSRSVGFFRSQLIWTFTVCHSDVNLYQQPGSSNLIG